MNANSTGTENVPVWDPLVRLFHWMLVASFAVAWLSGEGEDGFLSWHIGSGYGIGGLIVFRLLWGVIGTQHAKFRDFVYPPAVVLAYARDLVRGRPPRYLGHNPLGGVMVLALLAVLALAVLSGVALLAIEDGSGPLTGILPQAPEWAEEGLEEFHEFFSHLALLLVGLHIAGVLVSGRVHHENLVRAMITGHKRA